MQTQIIQKAIVLNKSGDMLMVRRSKTDVRRPLQWDLPGGMYEDGEELMPSVRREIDEETGLRVTHLLPIYSTTRVRRWNDEEGGHISNVVFIFYKAMAESTEVELSNEHDKFQWKPINEAVNDYDYDLHKDLLKYAIKNELV